MNSKLTPLNEPFPDNVADILDKYPKIKGELLSLFKVFAHSARFLTKGIPNLLDGESPLDLRTREIIILRVTANNECEYEWGVHVAVFGEAVGFTEAQIADTLAPNPNPRIWSEQEINLISCVDDFCVRGSTSPENLLQFQANWTTEQQLEIFALCGTYKTVSLVANTANLPPEDFAARFPVEHR